MKMPLRYAPGLLVLVVALVAGSAGGAKSEGKTAASEASLSKPLPDTWHATTFVDGSMGLHVIRYWSKGSWMRAETLLGGHPIITIVRDQEYIAFDELEGRGARVLRAPRALEDDRSRSRPFGNELSELIAQGAVKVEDSTRVGRAVEVWRKTDDAGRRKLWITAEEPRLPMRLETFVRSGAETITTDYSSWTRGLAIPDSFFEAPANVTLEELDYATFLKESGLRPIGPVLYPEMLHGVTNR